MGAKKKIIEGIGGKTEELQEPAPGAFAEQELSGDTVVMNIPEGMGGVGFGGEYYPAEDGKVTVPKEAEEHLAPFGLTRA